VTLNVGSALHVPANFSQGNRTLRLSGEALLTVAHADGTPFTVMAGNTTARVLGTTFVVRRYASDTATLVAVRDGKVAVRSNVVTAQQQANVFADGRVRVMPVDSTAFEFASGVLTLGWMPLQDAIVELDRWYDVDIVLADPSLATRPIKASFASGAASDLASILSLMLHARVEHQGRRLTVYPQ
jgi:ferric-dicitrate binding protein FerR (iron transport regulator)